MERARTPKSALRAKRSGGEPIWWGLANAASVETHDGVFFRPGESNALSALLSAA